MDHYCHSLSSICSKGAKAASNSRTSASLQDPAKSEKSRFFAPVDSTPRASARMSVTVRLMLFFSRRARSRIAVSKASGIPLRVY